MRKIVTGLLALLLLSAVAAPAVARAAAPQYQSSDPSDGEEVHQAPERVEVTFDQPLDPSSKLEISDDCGNRIDEGPTEVQGISMTVGLAEMPSGTYRVKYIARGFAGVTGEGTGYFAFLVHGGSPCEGERGHHPGDPKGGHQNGHGGNRNHGNHGEAGDDHSVDPSMTNTDPSSMGDVPARLATSSGSQAGGSNNEDNGGGSIDRPDDDGEPDGIISADTSRKLVHRADSGALIAALALCVVLGIVGGAVLRASPLR